MLLQKLTKYLFFKYAGKQNNTEIPLIIYNDWIGKNIVYNGFYEKDLVDIIISSLDFDTSNHVGVDVGANIGNHTLQFSKKFKKVIGFEPQIKTFKILKLNTEHLDNIKIYNFGLSNKEKIIPFKIPFNNIGGASQNYKGTMFYTETITLKKYDSLFKDEISFIKIDVEGNETDVLKSMEESIQLYKPVISFEMNSTIEERIQIIELLEKSGYKSFFVPNEHFIEKKIPTNTIFNTFLKFIIKKITPSPQKKLVEIESNDLIYKTKTFSLVTTFNEDSIYKLKLI